MYEITLYDGPERVREVRTSNEPFETIKSSAREHVELGIAQRAEVRNGEGELVYHFPRALKPANHPRR